MSVSVMAIVKRSKASAGLDGSFRTYVERIASSSTTPSPPADNINELRSHPSGKPAEESSKYYYIDALRMLCCKQHKKNLIKLLSFPEHLNVSCSVARRARDSIKINACLNIYSLETTKQHAIDVNCIRK